MGPNQPESPQPGIPQPAEAANPPSAPDIQTPPETEAQKMARELRDYDQERSNDPAVRATTEFIKELSQRAKGVDLLKQLRSGVDFGIKLVEAERAIDPKETPQS